MGGTLSEKAIAERGSAASPLIQYNCFLVGLIVNGVRVSMLLNMMHINREPGKSRFQKNTGNGANWSISTARLAFFRQPGRHNPVLGGSDGAGLSP
jgi:hypothetical protein